VNWIQGLNQRERVLVALTVTAALGGFLYVSILEPTLVRWTKASDEVAGLSQQLYDLQSRVKEQQDIGEQVRVLDRALAARNGSEGAVDVTLREVEQLIRSARLELKSIRPLDKVREGDYDRCPIEVTLRGDTVNFFGLLARLQAPENFLSVESMSISVGNAAPPLTLTMTIARLTERVRNAT
jgi:Tfp pilus assembly protein PilO